MFKKAVLSHHTKKLIYQACLALALAPVIAFLAGCSLAATEQGTSGQTVLIPWAKDGQYKFTAVPLDTLTNAANLQGSAAMFLLSPSIQDSRLIGFQPRVRVFQDNNGVNVPTDDLSIQLLTLYAHLEKLQELDASVGLGALLPKPRVVGVEVRIPQKQKGQVENNALYSPQLDALLFVPFTGKDLPLAVNAGVIAHEHFHSLFNFMVLQPARARIRAMRAANVHAQDQKQMEEIFENLPVIEEGHTEAEVTPVPAPADNWELYHVNLLRAMNEGLADVWGWVYSGDAIFVRRSIPEISKGRDLDVNARQIMTVDAFRNGTLVNSLNGNETETAYQLGTQYARAIKNTFEPLLKAQNRPRADIARVIVGVLPKIKEEIEKVGKNEFVKPSFLIDLFVTQLKKNDFDACEALLKYNNELAASAVDSRCLNPDELDGPATEPVPMIGTEDAPATIHIQDAEQRTE